MYCSFLKEFETFDYFHGFSRNSGLRVFYLKLYFASPKKKHVVCFLPFKIVSYYLRYTNVQFHLSFDF